MSTILSNIIEPTVFSAYTSQLTVEKSALIQSGMVARSDALNARANEAGSVSHLPFWNPFAWTAANVASDDPSVLATPNGLTAAQMLIFKDYLAQSWSTMELAEQVSGEDIVGQVANGVATYWTQELQRQALARLKSIATDNADMVHDISSDTSDALTAANNASFEAMLDTRQTMGDHGDSLKFAVMHSQVFNNLMKLEKTAYVAPSTITTFKQYADLQVIIDDNITTVAGTNHESFYTYLLAPSAFVYGEAAIPDGTEIWRNPAAGNAYGEERLYSRKKFFLHPVGFSANATITSRSKSPTLTQWGASGAFTRVYDRKLVPIAMLKSNG